LHPTVAPDPGVPFCVEPNFPRAYCLEGGGSTYFEGLATPKQRGFVSHKTAIFIQGCENLNLIIASLQNLTY
jgi:hypothetical protein